MLYARLLEEISDVKAGRTVVGYWRNDNGRGRGLYHPGFASVCSA